MSYNSSLKIDTNLLDASGLQKGANNLKGHRWRGRNLRVSETGRTDSDGFCAGGYEPP
jgi:hypothetical protein